MVVVVCTTGPERKFCVAHGGGKRCAHPEGCKSEAADSFSDFCGTHGGGPRCMYNGGGVCPHAAAKAGYAPYSHGAHLRHSSIAAAAAAATAAALTARA